jgi:hypothetical protein
MFKKQIPTQNKKQILNVNAHLSFAFMSALPAISSSHNSRNLSPELAAQCRAVRWSLEQKIRSKVKNKIQHKISKQNPNINAHLFFALTSALPSINRSQIA